MAGQPSMEHILNSIKRIIAEDTEAAPPVNRTRRTIGPADDDAEPQPSPAMADLPDNPDQPADEVLELTDAVEVEGSAPAEVRVPPTPMHPPVSAPVAGPVTAPVADAPVAPAAPAPVTAPTVVAPPPLQPDEGEAEPEAEADTPAVVSPFAQPAPAAAAPIAMPRPTPRPDTHAEPVMSDTANAGPILSGNALNASREKMAALSSLVVKPEVAGSDTLEGLVREMLRPMLAEWLDKNLPDVVERMVAKEVARISSQG